MRRHAVQERHKLGDRAHNSVAFPRVQCVYQCALFGVEQHTSEIFGSSSLAATAAFVCLDVLMVLRESDDTGSESAEKFLSNAVLEGQTLVLAS